jgi:hypothetical protein
MDFGTDIGVQPRIAHWPTRQLELRPAAYTMKCPNGGAGRLLDWLSVEPHKASGVRDPYCNSLAAARTGE